MKKIFSIFPFLFSCIVICKAQTTNTPLDNSNAPGAATQTLITLPPQFSPTTQFNFSRTFVPFVPVTDPGNDIFNLTPSNTYNNRAAVATSYVNGWGAGIETIKRGSTIGATSPDIVLPQDDRASLTSNSFLPYTATAHSQFQLNPFSDQQTWYQSNYSNENNMSYGQKILSFDGQQPVVTAYAPGSSFVGQAKGTTSELAMADGPINQYIIRNGGVVANGSYDQSVLLMRTTTGQHGQLTKEYLDLQNQRLLCKKVYDGTHWQSTYYVYDEMNRLAFVSTPSGLTGMAFTGTAYQYAYNQYGQLTNRKVPGKTADEITVYDNKHRPVLYQTPLLASVGQYAFTIYDARDRVVETGLLNDSNTPATWQGWIYNPATTTVTYGTVLYCILNDNANSGTDGNSPPSSISNCQINVINYYDNPHGTFNTSFASDYSIASDMVIPVNYPLTQGLLTQSLVRVRAPVVANEDWWLTCQYFYDQKGHLIQTQQNDPWQMMSTHTLSTDCHLTSKNIITSQYNFAGEKVLDILSYSDIPCTGGSPTVILTKYNYDEYNGGRLSTIQHKINSGNWTTVSTLQYDQLGRESQNSLGGVEKQNYTYNIRGQLTGINSDYVMNGCSSSQAQYATFGCILDYDFGFTEPRYDGAIAGMRWRGAGPSAPERAYGYQYDAEGRLLSADFREMTDIYGVNANDCGSNVSYSQSWGNAHHDYSVSNLKYDANGNILSMNQMGTTPTGPMLIDKLTYTYNEANGQLQKVADPQNTAAYNLGDFQDVTVNCNNGGGQGGGGTEERGDGGGSDSSGHEARGGGHEARGGYIRAACPDYAYDADGNLIKDANKHIASIAYNEQDLPTLITFENGSTIENLYDATGTLVKKAVTDAVAGTTSINRYWGPFVYQSDGTTETLQYILHPEGRARYNATNYTFTYDYFVRDHQGNVRDVVSAGQVNLIPYYAGYEDAHAAAERAMFSNVDSIRTDRPGTFDTSDLRAGMLDASDSSKIIGTSIILHVMAGDQFDLAVDTYWDAEDSAGRAYTNPDNVLSAIMTSLVAGGGTGGGDAGMSGLVSNLFTPDNYLDAYEGILDSMTNYSIPRAYLNYLVFDENMNLIGRQSSALQVGATPGSWQTVETPNTIKIHQNGYIVVYESNMQIGQAVYYNNLHVNMNQGVLLQEQHYYPFGLAINMGEAPNAVHNRFQFETNEKQDELGLNLSDFNARQYDYQIGRFINVDPLADQLGQESMNPYHFCGNDPVNSTDPWGLGAGNTGGRLNELKSNTSFYIAGSNSNGSGNMQSLINWSWNQYFLGANVTNITDADGNIIGATATWGYQGNTTTTDNTATTDQSQSTSTNQTSTDQSQQSNGDNSSLEGINLLAAMSNQSSGSGNAGAIAGGGGGNSMSTQQEMYMVKGMQKTFNTMLQIFTFGMDAVMPQPDWEAGAESPVIEEETVTTVESGTALARSLGLAGEDAVGIQGPKTAITINGRIRIPDRLTDYTLEEVKNVKTLSYTRQLRDFYDFSQQNNLDMILYTRPNTILSRPLQEAIDNGNILRQFIPSR